MNRKFRHLRTRLLAFMLAVVVLMTASMLFVVQIRMQEHVRRDLAEALANESVTLEQMDLMRGRETQQTARLLAEQPLLKALMTTHHPATIQDGSEAILRTSDADLLLLQANDGEVLALHSKSDDVPLSTVKRLLESSSGRADWWYAGGHLFQVGFAEITAGAAEDSNSLGRIAVGRELSPEVLQKNAVFANSKFVFMRGGKVLRGTLESELGAEFETRLKAAQPGSEPFEMRLRGEHYLAHSVQLSGDHAVTLYFLRSYDQATGFVRTLNRLLLLLGAIAVLAGATTIFVLARQITSPLERLADSAHRIQAGDFSFELKPDGNDEVAQLTVAFDQMRTSILQSREGMVRAARLEAVGKLAGGVAHDFNNLVMIIRGYSDLLLDSATGKSRSHIEEIKRAGDRASALTRQLLAFSRRQVLQPQVLDPNATIANMVKMLRILIGEDIELVTNLSEKSGTVQVDPGQLEQVIMNLAVNARDAMPAGGKLIIETQRCELDEEYAARYSEVTPGAYVRIAVTDTGIGMPRETLDHIFEPFFTTKEPGKGTGLGLATVYGIVKQSRGHISVYSELNIGTTFKVYLPAVDKSVITLPKTIESAPRGDATVLLVEDEPALRVLTAESLKRLGYKVLQAGNGLEAIAIADQHPEKIDIVITDIVMPRMGGPEFVEKLKQKRGDVSVIYMSGYTESAMLEQVQNWEGSHLLQKPFSTEALARRMVEVLPLKA
jgi:signal transduction histidine kinase